MKAKIKLKLTAIYDCQRSRNLEMILEIKDKPFSSSHHRYIIIDGSKFEYITSASKDNFYNDVYNFITDKNQIIKMGEELLKDILKDKLKENKIEVIEKLIKDFKPIEIEVK